MGPAGALHIKCVCETNDSIDVPVYYCLCFYIDPVHDHLNSPNKTNYSNEMASPKPQLICLVFE